MPYPEGPDFKPGITVAQCDAEPCKYDPQSRHYDMGGIETLDIIKAKCTAEEYRGFLKGNAIKYLSRMEFKGDCVADARKAATYTKWLYELIKGES
jgi:hypothetical protein